MWLIVAHIHRTLKGFKSAVKCEAETRRGKKGGKINRKLNHFINQSQKGWQEVWFYSKLSDGSGVFRISACDSTSVNHYLVFLGTLLARATAVVKRQDRVWF